MTKSRTLITFWYKVLHWVILKHVFFGNLPVRLCTWRLAGVLKSSTFAKKRERRKGNRQNGKQHAETAEVTPTALFCTFCRLVLFPSLYLSFY